MLLYTSYYANFRNIPADFLCVGISRFCPEAFLENDYPNFLFVKGNFLAPPADLLSDYKAGNETEEGYKRRYIAHLLSNFGPDRPFLSIEDYVSKLDETFSPRYSAIVFMCYERPEDFCHRHLLRRLLTKICHIQCEEFGYKDEKPANALF